MGTETQQEVVGAVKEEEGKIGFIKREEAAMVPFLDNDIKYIWIWLAHKAYKCGVWKRERNWGAMEGTPAMDILFKSNGIIEEYMPQILQGALIDIFIGFLSWGQNHTFVDTFGCCCDSNWVFNPRHRQVRCVTTWDLFGCSIKSESFIFQNQYI